jgi:hypothetical protein
MNLDVSPLGASPYAASSLDRTQRASGSSQASFPRTGACAAPPIPIEVWDQVDDAACLAADLTAGGRQVRFDVHKLDGGAVVASLVDENGGLLRPLLLKDVVDVSRLSHELGRES